MDVWTFGRMHGKRGGLPHKTAYGPLLPLVGGLLAVLVSCANPVAPSGGPRDQTPPSIVETRPVRDTTNVPTDTRAVYIGFSEYVERSSLPSALSVTPRFEGRMRFDWGGQGVRIELPESLRDSTTYLFSLDTNLRDARGVSLDEPVTVAFSTGPRINRGQIQGRVVRPQEGQPQPKIDVYAYALPDSATTPPTPLPERPAYRTQTGGDGTFSFEYMREQRYYVVALKDNNRNQQPDPTEPFAVPPRLALMADSGQSDVSVPWHMTRVDTLAPRFQRVQPLSRKRLRLSFSEPIELGERRSDAWALRDSVAETPVAVRSVYQSPDRPDAVILRTAPMAAQRHALPLSPNLVTDTLGQALVPDTARFTAVPRSDTTRTRFRTFVPENVSPDSAGTHPLLPGQHPGVRFNQAPDSTALRPDQGEEVASGLRPDQGEEVVSGLRPDQGEEVVSGLRRVLSLTDTTGQSRSFELATEEGRTYRLRGNPPLQANEAVDVAVDLRPIAGPDTTYERRFRRVTNRVLGELEGRAVLADTTRSDATPDTAAVRRLPRSFRNRADADTLGVGRPASGRADSALVARRDSLFRAGPIVVELIPTESTIPLDRRTLTTAPESTFVFRELPEGTFRFRAFLDRNRNGRWDGGRIRSYVPAEPVTWSQERVDSRPRWTNVLPAPLRIPLLLPAPLPQPSPPVPESTAVDSTN